MGYSSWFIVHCLHVASDSYLDILKWLVLCDFAFFASLRETIAKDCSF
jgi:hypothetical protein